ncbi:MAG: hypothetical protein QNJ91_06095 [Gammaproteobacteria bacterium]|nr:hypothetical protein [Gammaproteobacteria bacterium]
MGRSRRRGPGRRLVLTLAALASLIAGYYLGQAWQRQPLADLTAVVYANGRAIDYPAGLAIADAAPAWRLFVAADIREPACTGLRRDYALVINRLAHRPDIQQRVRLSVLAYDRPEPERVALFTGGHDWVDVISADRATLDGLAGQLDMRPAGGAWCTGPRAAATLVAPDATAWALIPHEAAAIMARNIITLIDFVE